MDDICTHVWVLTALYESKYMDTERIILGVYTTEESARDEAQSFKGAEVHKIELDEEATWHW